MGFEFDFEERLRDIQLQNIQEVEKELLKVEKSNLSNAETVGTLSGLTLQFSTEFSMLLLQEYHAALMKYLNETKK